MLHKLTCVGVATMPEYEVALAVFDSRTRIQLTPSRPGHIIARRCEPADRFQGSSSSGACRSRQHS
jgi:hypothetical protein